MFLKCHLPLLEDRWTCSVSHWYDYLAIIFIPSTGLEDIITVTKSTQQALNENKQSLSLLNTEMSLMRKAAPQNWMALDIITASQRGTCASIQTDCHVSRPEESAHISSLLNQMRVKVNFLNDPTPSLGDLVNQWFYHEALGGKNCYSFCTCLYLHVPILLLCNLPPVQPESCQMCHLHFNKTPCWLFRAHCRKGNMWDCMGQSQGAEFWRRLLRRRDH